MEKNTPSHWLWEKKHLKLLDGSSVSMPDTPENQVAYPQTNSQKKGVGFPIARIVTVVSCMTGALLDLAIGPYCGKKTGEHALLRELLPTFEPGDVAIADNYYASFFLIAQLMEMKVDIVTTFLEPASVSKESIARLYSYRWWVELDLRSIKETMQMDILRGKTPEMVRKEIWAHLLAYNMVRKIMAQAAYVNNKKPRELSFKLTLQLIESFQRAEISSDDPKNYTKLLKAIASRRVGNRPGRQEPRMIKRRPKPFPKLMKDRKLYKREV